MNSRAQPAYFLNEDYHIIPESLRSYGGAVNCGILYGLAIANWARNIVEIGVQRGISTRILLHAVGKTKGFLTSMDIDPACQAVSSDDRWTFIAGRSQDTAPIPSDFLFVDGDHSYQAVCSDMSRHGRAVKDGGIVVLDDYFPSFPGKMRWVDERWDAIQPLVIGPFVIVRVTPQARAAF